MQMGLEMYVFGNLFYIILKYEMLLSKCILLYSLFPRGKLYTLVSWFVSLSSWHDSLLKQSCFMKNTT